MDNTDSHAVGKRRLDRDHKGDPIQVNSYTLYHRYAYRVECPRCSVSEGEYCVETANRGPVGGHERSPHQKRAELAREVFDTDDE